MAASTGTLVAAALETVGYHAQAGVLQDLSEMLFELSTLFYVGVGISGIFAVVLFGSFKYGSWALVGPGLVWFCLLSTTSASGVDWQFGDYIDETGKRQQVSGYTDISGDDATVSWVFHRYNELVSSISRNLIAILMDGEEVSAQVKFMARPRLTDYLYASQLENQALANLLKFGLQGECANAMSSMRETAAQSREMILAIHRKDAQQSWSETQVKFYQERHGVGLSGPEAQSARTYMQTTLQDMRTAGVLASDVGEHCGSAGGGYDLVSELEKFADGETTSATCEMIWCTSALNLMREAERILIEAEQQTVAKVGTDAERDALIIEMKEHIAAKMHPDSANGSVGDTSIIPVVIGGMLMRKAMVSGAQVDRNSRFAERSGYFTSPYRHKYERTRGELERTQENFYQQISASALQAEILELAMTLPYLQGVILYVLAAMYPFFVILLLVPDKATGLFEWMAWWAWVKSWDVGWAAVMIVDDVLWEFMPHFAAFEPNIDPSHGPITWLQAAYHDDPAYSLTMYYMLVSTMILGVPLVTGKMILGSKADLGTKLVNSFGDIAQRAAKAYGQRAAMQATRSGVDMRATTRAGAFRDKANNGHASKENADRDKRLGAVQNQASAAKDASQQQRNQGVAVGAAGAGGALASIAKLPGLQAKVVGAVGGAIVAGYGAYNANVGANGMRINRQLEADAIDLRIWNEAANADDNLQLTELDPSVQKAEQDRAASSYRKEHFNRVQYPATTPASKQAIDAMIEAVELRAENQNSAREAGEAAVAGGRLIGVNGK